MSSMVLQSNYLHNGTFIPNIFIDKYMPAANGAYVKVYLYLLRCLSDTSVQKIDISSIADHLDNTDSDIIRALCYWEKVDLLTIVRDDTDNITSITVNDLYGANHANQSSNEPQLPKELEELKELNDVNNKQYQFEKPTYSDAQIKQLTDQDEVKWMLNIIELYLQRLIKPLDLQLILYLYESLDFSTELILYLYEYCVSKNKTHPSYIEAVAVAWAKDEIDTLEKAETATALFNDHYNAVKKTFGLNRSLGHVEKQFVNKWTKEYKLSIELIVEACNRTILNIQKPDFKYADKIIENWHNKGVSSLVDIQTLDEEHAKKASKTNENANRNSNGTRGSNNNRFNAFPQRTYSKDDYSSFREKVITQGVKQ